jgi:hypothetical protein
VISYPFRENLEVNGGADGDWIRCSRCAHTLSRLNEDWRMACKRRLYAPTRAGPLTNVLDGQYLFEKLYCPSCGVLLNSDMVEEKNES